MSSVYCWQCGKDYAKDQVFDIPVFNKGFTIKWCFKCAKKQLKYTVCKLGIPEVLKKKGAEFKTNRTPYSKPYPSKKERKDVFIEDSETEKIPQSTTRSECIFKKTLRGG